MRESDFGVQTTSTSQRPGSPGDQIWKCGTLLPKPSAWTLWKVRNGGNWTQNRNFKIQRWHHVRNLWDCTCNRNIKTLTHAAALRSFHPADIPAHGRSMIEYSALLLEMQHILGSSSWLIKKNTDTKQNIMSELKTLIHPPWYSTF